MGSPSMVLPFRNGGGAVDREFLAIFGRSWAGTPAGFADAEPKMLSVEYHLRFVALDADIAQLPAKAIARLSLIHISEPTRPY